MTIPPAASRLQSITKDLSKAFSHAKEAAEGLDSSAILVEGHAVALALRRLSQLEKDMIDGIEDAPTVFPDGKNPPLSEIAKKCAAIFGVTMDRMRESKRSGGNVWMARRSYFYLSRKLWNDKKSFRQISNAVGLVDHTCARYGFLSAVASMSSDRVFYERTMAVERQLYADLMAQPLIPQSFQTSENICDQAA
jgi:hypothetical protein